MKKILVLAGPSGGGKTTLRNHLLSVANDVVFSVSHTSRGMRKGEKEAVDYYYCNEQQFQEKIDKGEFLEWAWVHGELKGTSWKEVNEKSSGKQILLLDIDVQGVKNLKDKIPEALKILVIPPSIKVLKERLCAREQEFNENVRLRLSNAVKEIKQYNLFDYVIFNDNLEDAKRDLMHIYFTYKLNTDFNKEKILSFLDDSGEKK